MPWSDDLKAIRNHLAESFDTDEKARLIIFDAGLDARTIAFGDTSQITWHNIIKDAQNRNEFEKLIEVCITNSGSVKLKTLYEKYKQNQNNTTPDPDPPDVSWWEKLVDWIKASFSRKRLVLLLIPVVLITLGGVIYWFFIPKPPTEITLSKLEENEKKAQFIKDDIELSKQAEEWMTENSDVRFNIVTAKYVFEESKRNFSWKVSTPDKVNLTGRFYKLKNNEPPDPLQTTTPNANLIKILVPNCKKGEKLIAVIRIDWKAGDSELDATDPFKFITSEVEQ